MFKSLAIANSYILVRLVNKYCYLISAFLQACHCSDSILEYLWHINLKIDQISSLKKNLYLKFQAG